MRYECPCGYIYDTAKGDPDNGIAPNTKWEDIVKVIPTMREDSILGNENVKLGKFQGHETITYVANIMELYTAICRIYPRA